MKLNYKKVAITALFFGLLCGFSFGQSAKNKVKKENKQPAKVQSDGANLVY